MEREGYKYLLVTKILIQLFEQYDLHLEKLPETTIQLHPKS